MRRTLPGALGARAGGWRATAGARAAEVTLSVDFTSQTNGAAATLPAGATATRSSVRYVRTGLTTMGATAGADTLLSANVLAIGRVTDSDTTKGLWIEPPHENLQVNGRTFSSWTQGGTHTSGQTGPDGLASATHYAVTASSRALFSATLASQPAGTTALPWLWVKAGTTQNFQWGQYATSQWEETVGGAGSLPTSWQVMQAVPRTVAAGTTTALIIGEGYGSASLTHPLAVGYYVGVGDYAKGTTFASGTAQDFTIWSASLEKNAAYASTYADNGTPRAAETLSFDAADVCGSRLIFEATITPEWSAAQIIHAMTGEANYAGTVPVVAVPNFSLWYIDALNYAEIAWDHAGQIRCVVAGVPVVFPTPPAFYYGVPITIHVDGGNGAATGWYDIGAGHVDFGTEDTIQPPLQPEGTIYLFATPSGGQIGGTVQSVTLSRLGSGVTGMQFYASPSGSGGGLLSSDPTTLEVAQALAAANGGDATIWLADGTYYQASTLDLTAGGPRVTYRAHNNASPIISGATLFAGTWTNTSGSKWTATISSAVDVEQLYVNGQRAVQPIALVPGGASNTWTVTSTGVTVDAATQTAVGAWTEPTADLAVLFRGSYSYYRAPVTAIAGTAWTFPAQIEGYIQSLYTAFGASVDHTIIYGYSGSASLVAAAGDFHRNGSTGVTTYYARTTDSMGSSPVVEVGTLDVVATLSGTLGAPATGIKLIGLTFEGGGNSAIRSEGYAFAGGGMTGGFHDGTHSYPLQTNADWALCNVQMEYTDGCHLYGCTIRRMGSNALLVGRGVGNGSSVEGLTVSDCLGTGLCVGATDVTGATEPDARKLTTVTIRRSSISSCGVAKHAISAAAGMAVGYVVDCLFDQVRISNVGEVGLSLQGPAPLGASGIKGNNTFRNIYVSAYCVAMGVSADAGGIHTAGDNQPASTLSGCVVSVTGGASNKLYYIDNYSAHLTITGCVADAAGGGSYYILYQYTSPLACHDIAVVNLYTTTSALRVPADISGLVNVTETGTTLAFPLGATAKAVVAQAGT